MATDLLIAIKNILDDADGSLTNYELASRIKLLVDNEVTDKMMELIREFAEIKLDGKDE
jgi:hypothetical protein